jgi:Na+:H+ antiporter, NhaA family
LVGKFAGVLGGARLAVALRLGALPAGVAWRDVVPVALLAGIGYTVSLLIARLAFESQADQEQAAAAVLAAAVLASVLAVALLRRRP